MPMEVSRLKAALACYIENYTRRRRSNFDLKFIDFRYHVNAKRIKPCSKSTSMFMFHSCFIIAGYFGLLRP